MIKTEPFINDGKNMGLIRTYSDVGYMIKQVSTGVLYTEAIDPIDCNRVYEETDILIESESSEPDDGDNDDIG